jgi:Uncharacterized conserved protein
VDEHVIHHEQTNPIFTIGHSTHSMADFLDFLLFYKIDALIDVRSTPFSRISHFNRDFLTQALKSSQIKYGWLGNQLGARRVEKDCYVNGQARYDNIAVLNVFKSGINRILKGSISHKIVIMCSEKEPLDCHRTLLICRELKRYKLNIRHILSNGRLEEHADTEERLMKLMNIAPNLFRLNESKEDLLEEAYNARSEQIAYRMIESMT